MIISYYSKWSQEINGFFLQVASILLPIRDGSCIANVIDDECMRGGSQGLWPWG